MEPPLCTTQGNCATEGNSGNCHSGERWMRKPSVHGGKWKSNEGIDHIANNPVNNMSFFMLQSDRWYVFKHCGRPNHLPRCDWNLNCHCGRKACSSTSPHYGNCHYGTSNGGIISLCNGSAGYLMQLSVILMLFLSFLDNFLQDAYIIFLKDVDNFEIEHKTC